MINTRDTEGIDGHQQFLEKSMLSQCLADVNPPVVVIVENSHRLTRRRESGSELH
jgi:hypothetical protein